MMGTTADRGRWGLELAFEHARVGMALGPADGHWTRVNAALPRLFGVRREALLGERCWELWPAETAAEDRARLPAVASGRTPVYRVERTLRAGDGPPVDVVLSVAAVDWSRVTAEATLLWQIERAPRRAGAPPPADRMVTVDRLLSGVAHELNSPLAALIASLRLASERLASERPAGAPTPGELAELLGEGEEAAARLDAIVRRMRATTADPAKSSRGPEWIGETQPGSPEPPEPPRRARVLVVDDDRGVTRAIRRMLRREHEVDTAGAGDEALGWLARDPDYDLILCDLMMPGVSGRQVWETLARRRPALLRRFVLMTGAALSEEARWLRRARVPVLPKPFDIDAVRALVRQAAVDASGPSASPGAKPSLAPMRPTDRVGGPDREGGPMGDDGIGNGPEQTAAPTEREGAADPSGVGQLPEPERAAEQAEGEQAEGEQAEGEQGEAEQPSPEEQGRPRLVVGLGASAGGLEALEAVLDATPPDTGMAFVVVSHQYPRAESLMPELLAKHTTMPVSTAADGMQLEPDHVYVTPPVGYLTLEDTTLRLSEADLETRRHLPIDRFFRSLGDAMRQRAACVVLSGSGSDGTVGLKAVKSQLGLALAQDPDTAKYGGMPSSAIATRNVDHVVPPGEVASTLLAYAETLLGPQPPGTGAAPRVQQDAVGQILTVVQAHTGHDFSVYKSSTIGRRIDRRMAVHRLTNPRDYLEHLRGHRGEVDTLFHELLINVTSFFRDPQAFEALQSEALERLLRGKQPGATLRVWVAGCATGEEAYSIAILLYELMQGLDHPLDVQIFATDVDETAISAARAGVYPVGIADDVSEARLERFFVMENGHYRVVREIRDMVVFAVQNVLRDPPFTRLDLLSCRNLLIYLDSAIQTELLPVFHYALAPQGILFIGTAETLGASAEDFEAMSKRWNIYRRKPAHVARGLARLPLTSQRKQAGAGHAKGRRGSVGEQSERILAGTVVPPSVIVDEHGQIQHVHGRTGAYLEPSPGGPEMNVFDMAREGLRPELMSALRQAARETAPVARRGVRVRSNGDSVSIDLYVRPVREPTVDDGYYVVTFEEQPVPAEDPASPEPAGDEAAGRIREIELELRATKETLQSTVEEYETANEELKSSNEELQSTNEELQSTNEELETAKEEQQSLNEELQTVNAELQEKMERLGQAHDDMRNLLNSTAIATLFLDKELRIKRFTPQATKIANLIESDVGRPISDLVTKLDYDALAEDAAEVLERLEPKQIEIQGAEETWYQMRMTPYRTSEDVIDGVVLTFVDVTRLKEAEKERDRERAAVRNVVNEVPSPALIIDDGLRVAIANDRFLDEVGMQRRQVEDRELSELGEGWDAPELRELLGREVIEQQVVEDRIEVELPRRGRQALELTARRIDEPGGPEGAERAGTRVLLTLRRGS